MADMIALDVGGTFIKYACFEDGQMRPGSLGLAPVDQAGGAEAIVNAFCACISLFRADCACVSIPGPMEYATGTSRMKHKFASLYGVSLFEKLRARFPGMRFQFAHDAVAYLAGVMRLGEAEGAQTPAGIMLGTGLGFVFAQRGQILINAADTPSFPLWNAPFEGGICEDFVSGRALTNAYQRETGEILDVKTMAVRAREGRDAAALRAFACMGEALGQMIEDRAARLSIDRVILGGQISKAADLFLPAARARTRVDIRLTAHPDDAALYGAYALSAQGQALARRAAEPVLPYGRETQTLHLHPDVVNAVLSPETRAENAPDAAAQVEIVRNALENPIGSPRLRELARGKTRVLVITSDHTRPVPSKITMPLLLSEIRAGSPDAEIVILLATGMHRASTPEEITEKLGEAVARAETVENHDCRAQNHMVFKGTLPSGGQLLVNDRVDWAQLIVAEGFIEPHFFAGFSGGRKSILPGIASEATVRYNHNARFIANERARQGVLSGNPIHEDMRYAARAANLGFILNVLIDGEKNIVCAVAGDREAAHEAGCALCLRRTGVDKREADVVVTSNGGYPLDQNVYQSVKGMTAAEACVRKGGAIVMVSRCADGVGGESFYQMLAGVKTPEELLRASLAVSPADTPADQWEAQILCRVLSRARVYMVTDEKNREAVERMHMRWAANADAAVRLALRETGGETVTVIPDGVGVIVRG